MPKPIKRRELLRRLRLFGWDGEYQHGKHPFMVKSGVRVTIPNPHRGDLDWSLVKRILKDADIDPDEWEQLK
jgi:predicted RNA binding protein YcfA (HicA-like mRNA interferase family)